MFFHPTFIILIPGILFGIYAQAKIMGAYKKYRNVPSERGLSGAEAAAMLLRSGGADDVAIEQIGGQLSDHYDPRSKVLRLSSDVYHGRSIAAVGIAAHEAGHALQHANDYLPLVIRNGFAPVASFGSQAWIFLFFIGLFFHLPGLAMAGVIVFTFVVFFQLVTLPVELNASKRAVAMLTESGAIYQEEIGPTKAVLRAAALTYVAGLVMAVLQLVQLLLLTGDD
ncbi:MAG: zinc metallopeptidase [Planctomycetes bacterium]|nr:zinc metallopeptidase [Planctomycetota bacterium]